MFSALLSDSDAESEKNLNCKHNEYTTELSSLSNENPKSSLRNTVEDENRVIDSKIARVLQKRGKYILTWSTIEKIRLLLNKYGWNVPEQDTKTYKFVKNKIDDLQGKDYRKKIAAERFVQFVSSDNKFTISWLVMIFRNNLQEYDPLAYSRKNPDAFVHANTRAFDRWRITAINALTNSNSYIQDEKNTNLPIYTHDPTPMEQFMKKSKSSYEQKQTPPPLNKSPSLQSFSKNWASIVKKSEVVSIVNTVIESPINSPINSPKNNDDEYIFSRLVRKAPVVDNLSDLPPLSDAW
jgi:hypothetical protein